MAPAPGRWHQKASALISHYLVVAVELAGLGEVYTAPFDVKLDARNTVQPDVLVVLNEYLDRLTEGGMVGAPDLVVEIALPSTARIDLNEKLIAYASAGVPEYWVVNPDARTVEVLTLRQGVYSSLGAYYGPAVLSSRVVPGLNVKVEQFFP
jgi:Uma2 family endonuclease